MPAAENIHAPLAKLTLPIGEVHPRKGNPRRGDIDVRSTHSCMSLRGVKATGAAMVTSSLTGAFRTDTACRAEFMSLTHGGAVHP